MHVHCRDPQDIGGNWSEDGESTVNVNRLIHVLRTVLVTARRHDLTGAA